MTVSRTRIADLTSEAIMQRLDGKGACNPARIELGFNPDPQLLRDAAVLIPLVRENNDWSVLLTARTEFVEDHKGQVSFPGGASEPEDGSPEVTALREAAEEIGLPVSSAHVLGCLAEYQTISNYLVKPVVAEVDWPFPLKLQDCEVRRAFTIPLEFLARPGNHTEHPTTIRGQSVPLVYFEPWDGEVLWGISARIMLDLLIRLGLME
jgi:8-oxo-dGTP pyrophosphatase MutT (NUDIX family)